MEREQGLFSGFFQSGKVALQGRLADCKDLTEVEDAVRLFWDSMQHDFTAKVTDERAKELGFELFVVAKSAISCMLSVSDADVLFKAKTPDSDKSPKKFNLKKYIGAGASALLTAYLLLESMWVPMAVSLIVTTFQAIEMRRDELKLNQAPALPEARGVPKADIDELMRRLERLTMNMDAAYARMLGESQKKLLPESVQWSPEQLQAVQMLWEALKQGDGRYALKTLPQLIMSLEQQGITLAEYSEDTAAYFECLPGIEDGYTIRPALMLGNNVIAKGQVTQKMMEA